MTTAAACIACLMLGYALGWRTRDRQIDRRAEDLRELRMMLSAHCVEAEVIPAEVEIAREVA